MGDEEAEVAVFHPELSDDPPIKIVNRTSVNPNKLAVGGGAGLKDSFSLIEQLSEKIEGLLVASNSACSNGLAAPELKLGLGGIGLESDTYLACGLSGSEEHLAGLAPHTKVIAINHDPEAPIFKIAEQGMVADAKSTLEKLLERLQEIGK